MPTQEEIKAKLRGKYGEYKQRAEERGNFTKADHWSPHIVQASDVNDEGDEIRIVPYPFFSSDDGVPALSFEEVVMQGKRRTYDKETKTYTVKDAWIYLADPSPYGCPNPIRDFRAELKKSTDPDDKALYKRLASKESHLCLIYEIKHPEKGLQIWKFGAQVMEQLLKWAAHSDYAIPWDPKEGHNLWVKRTGKGLDTEYTVTPRPMRTPMPEPEKLMALAAKIDLAWQVKVDTPETLLEFLNTDIYDEKLAAERRDERDKTVGRPVPLFIKKGESKEDTPAASKPAETPKAPDAPAEPAKRRPGRPAGSTNKPADPPAAPQAEEKKDDIPMFRFKADEVVGRKITYSLDGETQSAGKCTAYDGNTLTVVDLDDNSVEVPEDNVIEVGPAKTKPAPTPPPAPPPPAEPPKAPEPPSTPPQAPPAANTAAQDFKAKMAAMRAAAEAKKQAGG